MSRILLFTDAGFTGTVKEYTLNDPDLTLNDPDLTLNGDDVTFASAIVLSGSWNLYDDINQAGNLISLTDNGAPNSDGAYKDHADWGGAAAFHVKSAIH